MSQNHGNFRPHMIKIGQIGVIVAMNLFALGADCNWENTDPATPVLPRPDHIVIVILENKNFDQVFDTSAAPYLQSLINGDHTAVFTDSRAMGHPSQPNYFWMFSGEDQGVTTNDRPAVKFNTPNLAASLEAAGYSFKTYSEGLPYAGYDGDQYDLYVRKHNPMMNWVGIYNYQIDAALSQPFTSFPENYKQLPTLCYVVPDLINGMHDGTIAQGDDWLELHMSDYIDYAINNNALFVLTFDETGYDVTDNRILTMVIGRDVVPGLYHTSVSHINWLRTWEDMYGLQHAGLSGYLEPVTNCWKTP